MMERIYLHLFLSWERITISGPLFILLSLLFHA
jgi:hypothetical protein